MSNFQRIDWGPIENTKADLGTDLLLQARDERRFDRGCLVGAQIKAGHAYFTTPQHGEDGDVVGWWYAESNGDHFDGWVQHALPHLLVLQDLETRESFWVEITAEAIQTTGKGAKILVPRHQTVDRAHLPALMEVAARHKSAESFQGSAYGAGAGNVSPNRRLRHAFLVPRLIAPHRSATPTGDLQPEEAVAMLLQARGAEFDAAHTLMSTRWAATPDRATRAGHRDWRWRFVNCMQDLLEDGSTAALLERIEDAPSAQARTAAEVLYVHALVQEDRHDEAISFLTPRLADADADDRDPVDRAWLLTHLASLRTQVGEVEQARREAAEALRALVADPQDVTAAAISGVAIWILYATGHGDGPSAETTRTDRTGWASGRPEAGTDVEEDRVTLGGAISSSDTAVSWWRTQTFATGLENSLDRTFRRAVHDSTRFFWGGDSAHNKLLTAWLTASLSGDHALACEYLATLGQHHLVTGLATGTEDDIRAGLDELRRGGDWKSLGMAAQFLYFDGPLTPLVHAVVTSVPPWTHVTALAHLTLWEHAGDLLEAAAADEATAYCLEILARPDVFAARIRPTFTVAMYVLRALTGLVLACSPEQRRAVLDLVVRALQTEHDHDDVELTRILNRLDQVRTEVSPELEKRLLHAALDAPTRDLSTQVLDFLSTDAALAELHQRSESTSAHQADQALVALGDAKALSQAAARAALARCEGAVQAMTQEAGAGHFAHRVFPAAEVLTVLNTCWPAEARWECLIDLLDHPLVRPAEKALVCRTLARVRADLDDEAKALLRPSLTRLLEASAGLDLPFDDESLAGAGYLGAAAVGAFDVHQATDAFLCLLIGDVHDRGDAPELALVAGLPSAALLATLNDSHQQVRWRTLLTLWKSFEADPGDDVALVGLARAAQDHGVRVPSQLSCLLSERPADMLPAALQPTREMLLRHPAARVRAWLS